MQPWVWLAAYVLGFGLLQVLLYQHFREGAASPQPTEGRAVRGDGGRRVTSDTAETIACGNCGAVNESHRMIRYCSSCAESLR